MGHTFLARILREFLLGSRMCLTGNFFEPLHGLSFTKIIGLSPGADGGPSSVMLSASVMAKLEAVPGDSWILSAQSHNAGRIPASGGSAGKEKARITEYPGHVPFNFRAITKPPTF